MEINNNITRNMEQDPFKVRLKFTKSDYVKMAVMGVTILPIRILGNMIASFEIVLAFYFRNVVKLYYCLGSCLYWHDWMAGWCNRN